MTAYVYRLLSPKHTTSIVVEGVTHHAAIAVYAYKPGYSWASEKLNKKMDTLIDTWTRCWDGIDIPKYIVIGPQGLKNPTKKTSFVGCTVIESRNKRSFYDDPDWERQPLVGFIQPTGLVSKEVYVPNQLSNDDHVTPEYDPAFPVFGTPQPGDIPPCPDCLELYTEGMFCNLHRSQPEDLQMAETEAEHDYDEGLHIP